ncbi:MAG: enoyl-CoA hydratase/isomerase family protein, partial [Burkholderia vietnamiensis]|nr:enoyl-CoA hydratase/isomerase family protein [Burkholderia vietnamiensis]
MNSTASPAPARAGSVTHERRDALLVVTIDHPPVNALSADVRRGLADALDAAQADHAVRAVLIVGAGRNFIAGADIREFGKPPVPPSLPDVCERIESSAKPVVVALNGATLGGGLEVALAAHYRLALPGAKLG